MATVQSLTPTEFPGTTTSHVTTNPAGIANSDLLLWLVHCNSIPNGIAPTLTTPGGLTLLDEGDLIIGAGSNESRYALYARISDGTDSGAAVNFLTNKNSRMAVQCYHITGNTGLLSGVEFAKATDPITTTANPPNLAPSWGADDTLWIAAALGMDDDVLVLGYPTNYTDQTFTHAKQTNNENSHIASCRRTLNAASENPGLFTYDENELAAAFTIAVEPGTVVPEAPNNDTPMPDQQVIIGTPYGPFDVKPYWTGTPAPTYSASGLPNGLSISADGIISGTPTGGFQP